ncbi:MAG TPA: hypothetical protein VMV21_13160 [Vicinamibacteria bacterium]|nr:hypothetical protein [Vicinamibacteria bacterium]
MATFGLVLALAPAAWAGERLAAPVKCGTPMFLAPPPPEGHVPVMVMGGFGLEPSGRPVSGGIAVAVNPDRDHQAVQKPPGASPSLPDVDSPDLRFDVAVEIFGRGGRADDGVAEGGQELPSTLHRGEGRLLALDLRRTLEDSGHWGTVRVVPLFGEGFDVVVSGKVVYSGRDRLEIDVEAHDALGRHLPLRTHRGSGASAEREILDGIAADLVRWRDENPKVTLEALHAAALLRFGARLAPDVFDRYLPSPPDRDPAAPASRMPAPPPDAHSPLVERLRRVFDRDQTFLTVLNRHYAQWHDAMVAPYQDWRQEPSPEGRSAAVAALEEIVRSFDTPGAPSLVQAEGYEKMLAGSVEGQFLAWRRLAGRTLRTSSASVR